MLYCFVQYYVALHCIALLSIVLYCTVLYCIMLYCFILYCLHLTDKVQCCTSSLTFLPFRLFYLSPYLLISTITLPSHLLNFSSTPPPLLLLLSSSLSPTYLLPYSSLPPPCLLPSSSLSPLPFLLRHRYRPGSRETRRSFPRPDSGYIRLSGGTRLQFPHDR